MELLKAHLPKIKSLSFLQKPLRVLYFYQYRFEIEERHFSQKVMLPLFRLQVAEYDTKLINFRLNKGLKNMQKSDFDLVLNITSIRVKPCFRTKCILYIVLVFFYNSFAS